MKFTVNLWGVDVSLEFSSLSDLAGIPSDLLGRISDISERKQIEKFFTYRQFLSSEKRKLAAQLGGLYYYRTKGLEILHKDAPILYREEWIPSAPLDLLDVARISLKHRDDGAFNLDESIYVAEGILPVIGTKYSLIQKKYAKGIVLDENGDLVYRLMGIKTCEAGYFFEFGIDHYSNYIDTCELLAFEFCKEIAKILQNKDKHSADALIDNIELGLRRQIDPFDFSNRSAAAGINTILIFLDPKGRSSFYLHDRRNTKLAEAVGTLHVVPAGSFAPKHAGIFEEDFSFYNNIMREFGEELLGQEGFAKKSKDYSSTFDVEIIKKYSCLVEKKLGRVFYLGMGLDCLTTKPEILTALVFDKKVVDILLGGCTFKDNFEGEHWEVEFSEKTLDTYMRDKRMLPAGAACLYLVKKNFKLFEDCLG